MKLNKRGAAEIMVVQVCATAYDSVCHVHVLLLFPPESHVLILPAVQLVSTEDAPLFC